MEKWGKVALIAMVLIWFPVFVQAQGVAEKLYSLHGILDKLYQKMMPSCKELIGVGRGIAGFGALWYIGSRVWKHLANAEPIDFYPLFRPFVLGFCIGFFPLVIGVIDGLMKPTVTGTSAMVENSDKAVKLLLKQKEDAIKQTDIWQMYVGENNEGDRDRWYKYTHNNDDPKNEKWSEYLSNQMRFELSKLSYNFRNNVKQYMSEILKILFQAASLCINTLRTFQMIVLAIIGPLVFGIAVFDGFQHTLSSWLAKYLNVYMWLPVANIFGAIIGKIQEEMLKLDLEQVKEQGDTFFSATDTGYLIFMLIGIVGYFTVPSVSNFIINAGQGSAMLQKITSMVSSAPGMIMSTARGAGSMATSSIGKSMGNYANAGKFFDEGLSGKESGSGVSGMIGRAAGKAYMAKKLSGQDPANDRGQ